jgi:hypothetical protein
MKNLLTLSTPLQFYVYICMYVCVYIYIDVYVYRNTYIYTIAFPTMSGKAAYEYCPLIHLSTAP